MTPLSNKLLHNVNKDKIIGWSVQGRPLQVRFYNNNRADLRALIIAGQHGDEHLAREAASRFSRRFSPSRHEKMSVAILDNANPDGAAVNTRKNAQDRDLNRDHQLLLTPEAQAIHALVREWQPHVIIDVHTFAPRRKKLLAKDMVYYHDVYIDVANNPSLYYVARANFTPIFQTNVIDAMQRLGHRCDRYLVLSPLKQFRHSSADILDARNGLALRHQTFTVLLEGREGSSRDAEERTVEGLCCGIEQVLKWCNQYNELLKMRLPSPMENVSIRNRYESNPLPRSMTFLNARETTARLVDLHLHNYVADVVSTKQVCLPEAYAVPLREERVLSILARHGFATTCESIRHAEQYIIREMIPSTVMNRAAQSMRAERRIVSIFPEDYALYPVRQRGGNALAVFLEPESKYGLCRHRESGLMLAQGDDYPVLRVFQERH